AWRPPTDPFPWQGVPAGHVGESLPGSQEKGAGGPAGGGQPRPTDPQSPPPEARQTQAGGGPAGRHRQGQPSAAGEAVPHPEARGADPQRRHLANRSLNREKREQEVCRLREKNLLWRGPHTQLRTRSSHTENLLWRGPHAQLRTRSPHTLWNADPPAEELKFSKATSWTQKTERRGGLRTEEEEKARQKQRWTNGKAATASWGSPRPRARCLPPWPGLLPLSRRGSHTRVSQHPNCVC
ncbi:hypothetical protein CapIbe_011152, partial [Capra ibex]